MDYITSGICIATAIANTLFFRYQNKIVKSQKEQLENAQAYLKLFNIDEFIKYTDLKITNIRMEEKKYLEEFGERMLKTLKESLDNKK